MEKMPTTKTTWLTVRIAFNAFVASINHTFQVSANWWVFEGHLVETEVRHDWINPFNKKVYCILNAFSIRSQHITVARVKHEIISANRTRCHFNEIVDEQLSFRLDFNFHSHLDFQRANKNGALTSIARKNASHISEWILMFMLIGVAFHIEICSINCVSKSTVNWWKNFPN